jgi:hypothetical protein
MLSVIKMKIDFEEISDWEEFEDLVADYFREIKKLDNNQIIDVKVAPSGKGPDGGRDILVNFRLNDSIVTFERRWVVQCKFRKTLLKSNLDSINIPTLIQEYGACGYLLIAKNSIQSGVTQTFENLRNNCKNGFFYETWNGNHFRQKLGFVGKLHEQYFPKYFEYIQEREARIAKIKQEL